MNRVTHIENEKGPTSLSRNVDPSSRVQAPTAKQIAFPETTPNPIQVQHGTSAIDVATFASLAMFAVYRETVCIAPKEAAHLAGVSPQTVVRWCTTFGIGFKIAGRWIVDRERLAVLLTGGLR